LLAIRSKGRDGVIAAHGKAAQGGSFAPHLLLNTGKEQEAGGTEWTKCYE
jgi:hypothetical protein